MRLNRFLPLLFYVLLALIVLHPMIWFTGSQAAGFDYFNYHWNFWWIRHVLTTPGLTLFQTDYTFFPVMNNLGYHALTAFWFPVWALLEPLTDTYVAMTAIITLAAVLNGWLTYVLLRRLGVAVGLALLGGAALQVTPLVRYFYYNTHINLMDWFWLAGSLLLWQQVVRAAESGRLARLLFWSAVMGLGLYGIGLTDLQFPIFTAFVLAPYSLYTLWQTRQRGRLILGGMLALGLALALLWLAGPLPWMLRFEGTLAPGPVDERPGVPFPRGYFSVDAVWWNWNTPTLGGFVTINLLLALAVSLTPLRRHLPRARWFWLLVLLPPLILSLGPSITLFGAEIPMPFRLLHAVTNGMFRMPWRLAPIYIFAAVIFIGLTWTPLLARWNRGRRLALLALAFGLLAADARIFQSGPLRPVLRPYTFYETIGAERGQPYDELVLLDVPTGVGTGEVLIGDERAITLQMYTMTHEKRTVNGFISRAPTESFWYLNTDDPMLSWLGQRRFLEPEAVERQLRQRIFDWPLGYIVIHRDIIGYDGPTVQEIIGFLNQFDDLLCPLWIEGDAVVYRTAAHPDGCPPRTPSEIEPGVYEIDLGAPGDERFTGWGWHRQEQVFDVNWRWAGQEPQARLYIDLPPGAYEVTVLAQAFWEPRTLQVRLNGQPVGAAEPVPVENLAELRFMLPADQIGSGQHLELTLVYDGVLIPNEVGQSADGRRLAISVERVRFRRLAGS